MGYFRKEIENTLFVFLKEVWGKLKQLVETPFSNSFIIQNGNNTTTKEVWKCDLDFCCESLQE